MSDRPTLAKLLAFATQRLEDVSPTARLDAEVLLAAAVQKPREFLFAWPDSQSSAAEVAAFEVMVQRRAGGEPVSYITGWREFWSQDLMVTPDVLVPRPETEDLVRLALEQLPRDEPARVADVGTGSGNIAIAIAIERPLATVLGIDVSAAALDVARSNCSRLDIANIEFAQNDLLGDLEGEPLDLVASNLPYVATEDPAMEALGVRFEPRLALDGGDDGLNVIRRLVAELPGVLNAGGTTLLEHGCDQGPAVRELLAAQGFQQVMTHQDDAHLDRITQGKWQ
jgi:release factor glutamine methyltransferase